MGEIDQDRENGTKEKRLIPSSGSIQVEDVDDELNSPRADRGRVLSTERRRRRAGRGAAAAAA